MTKSGKTHSRGFMNTPPKRWRGKKLSGDLERKVDKTFSAGFTTCMNVKVSGAKLSIRRELLDMGYGIPVETETAIYSAQEAVGKFKTTVSQPHLESDDMWFGDPKAMPDNDLAFFGLEK